MKPNYYFYLAFASFMILLVVAYQQAENVFLITGSVMVAIVVTILYLKPQLLELRDEFYQYFIATIICVPVLLVALFMIVKTSQNSFHKLLAKTFALAFFLMTIDHLMLGHIVANSRKWPELIPFIW